MVIYNEIEVINIFSNITSVVPKGVVGIGDDCAVLPFGVDESMVITTDTLTENTHFILDKITPYNLGYKSLASNISDVIAMGATPTYAFLSITLGGGCSAHWVEEFARGFSELSKKHQISLIGGDTTQSSLAVTITITLIGSVKNSNIKLRSGAKNGDIVFCLNNLGGSAAGLKLLLAGEDTHPLIDTHYKPKLFVEQAQWLAKFMQVHSMMDISDGIAKDFKHILNRSNLGAYINLDMLPIDNRIFEEDKLLGVDVLSLAVEGGEEYAPLFTVQREFAGELMQLYKDKFGIEMYAIGSVSDKMEVGVIEWRSSGVKQNVDYKGYTHL